MNNSISSYSLLTDLYQLTMSYGYWKAGMHTHESVFHLFYRKNPFRGGFSIAAGLEAVTELLENFRFEASDIAYLQTLIGNDGQPLFEKGFLEYLANLKMDCTVHAIPEGTVVFPHEPLLRIQGNIILCQLLETPLLNILNFQTLIATKAARVCKAAAGESVLEFGLRRAQGKDGALSASRAAYIGGCHATSNVLAGKLYGIPVKGTHAHSWVMSFRNEPEAFAHYAVAMPNNCVFLVDTYDTIQGVKYAIEEGEKLRNLGFKLAGIRLDSGDLAALSIEARKLLDEAGFEEAAIVASNDLDEYTISALKAEGAKINIWGVGTKLVTAYDQPALGGVYKLSAIRSRGGEWEYRVKLSEQIIKVSNPGVLQVRRWTDPEGNYLSDMIYSETFGNPSPVFIDFEREAAVECTGAFTDLLIPVFEQGRKVYENPPLDSIRSRTLEQLSKLPEKFQVFQPESSYPCGLEQGLYQFKKKMIEAIRG
ncbi:MAG: nicotinate phosphoribosyltransferase [Bacteroidia bacterium]|nr:nicotinate phosphoribosyltransferase [Bacteroidia bacterium]